MSRLAFVLAVGILCADARSAVITLGASKDNTLYQRAAGDRSNGAGSYLFAGITGAGGGPSIRRGLLAFDVSAIPDDAIVTDVSLRLNMSRSATLAQAVTLHRVLANWGEGTSNANAQEGRGADATTNDATWLHTFYPGSFWSNPGGDYVPAASATTMVEFIQPYTWSSSQMVSDVQGWIDGSLGSFGWMVIGEEGTEQTTKRFDSRENTTPANRPALTITYTVVPEPASCALAATAAALLARRPSTALETRKRRRATVE